MGGSSAETPGDAPGNSRAHPGPRLRSLVEATRDAIVVADERGRIVAWNPAAEHIFGYDREEVLGAPLTCLIPERFRRAHREGLTRFLETGASRVMGRTLEVSALRRDGSEVPVELSLDTWTEHGERYFGGIVRDVSQREATEEALAREQRLTSLLKDVAVASNEADDPAQATQEVLERVCEATNASVGHAYVTAPADDRLQPTDLWHAEDPDRFRLLHDVTMGTWFEIGEGLPGRVAARGEPASVSQLSKGTRPVPHDPDALGVRSAFALPVLVADETVAVLEFFSEEDDPPDESLLDRLSSIGAQLGRVYERRRTMAELEAREERFRLLAEAASEGVFVIEDEEVTDVNSAGVELLGRPRDEIVGEEPVSLVADVHEDLVRRRIQMRAEGPYACLVESGEDEYRWLRVEAAHVQHEGRVVRISRARDVTDRLAVAPDPKEAPKVDPVDPPIDPESEGSDAAR